MRAFVLPSVFVVALSLPLALGLAACGADDAPPEGAAPLELATQPIINGAVDNAAANDAVVGLRTNGGACTGTVFKIEGNVTWILTAAHCIGSDMEVSVGPDYENPSSLYRGTGTPDARYGDGQELSSYPYDVGIVKVNGAIPVTPISLADASDGLAQGSVVRSYGYGTTVGYNSGVPNSQRHTIERPISSLTATYIVYNQSDESGICAGDSGGPVVSGAGAARRLVGVHSNVGNPNGNEPCFGEANSVRVSSRFDFIDAVLNRTPLPQPSSCQVCSTNASSSSTCEQKRTRCVNDDDCMTLAQCLQGARTDGAVNACITQRPNGVGPYVDFVECGCSDVCVDECVGDSACSGVAKCGIAFTGIIGGTLTKCIEANCCDQADAASADGEAYVCLTESAPAASCTGNAKFAAYKACMDANCEKSGSSSSGSPGSSSGGEDVADDDAGGDVASFSSSSGSGKKKTTTTTTGCAVSGAGGSTPGGAGLGLALGAAALLRARRRRG